MVFSSTGFRFPLTTLPTLEPLLPGRMILEMAGLAFFISLVDVVPMGAAAAFGLAVEGCLNMLSLALLLCGAPGSSVTPGLDWTGCPDMVRFRCSAPNSDDAEVLSIWEAGCSVAEGASELGSKFALRLVMPRYPILGGASEGGGSIVCAALVLRMGACGGSG